MRVLKRHNEADEAREAEVTAEADAPATDTTTTTTGGRRTFLPGWRRNSDADAASADTTPTPAVEDRDRTERIETRPVTTEAEIRTELWSWADVTIAVIGAGLALVGLIALARAGVDRTWYRPTVHVLDANHTAALGAAEVAAGALLILAGIARSRPAAALLGLAIAVAGALAAIENEEVRTELAIEKWWAWVLAGVGLLVAVVALAPPRRSRVERVLETR